jgi:outer membrane receptor protein involved in Fe transport
VDGRADYDFPDGKQHFTFAGAYMRTSGIYNGGLGPFRIKSSASGYGKMDYVRGTLRITGYANAWDWWECGSVLLIDPSGRSISCDGQDQAYHLEFGDSRAVDAKHLISYGASFRHNEFNLAIAPEGKSRNEGGAYVQDEILLSKYFRWIVGTRIDKFDNLKGVVFSPRTTFLVKTAPGQTFRFSYNRAYMAPYVQLNYMKITFMYGLDLGLIDPQLAGNYFSFPTSPTLTIRGVELL